jgi:translation initiation factor IF-2
VSIRIYALAKELGIENKELVDACDRAGIKGKGSALASLNEEEVSRIKSFLAETKPASPAETREAPQRPQNISSQRRPPVLTTKPKKSTVSAGPLSSKTPMGSKAPLPTKPVAEHQAPRTATPPMAAGPVAKQVEAETLTPEVVRRDSIVPKSDGPIRNLDARRRNRDSNEKTSREVQRKRPGLNVKVAAMPDVEQPTARKTSDTAKVHKPDISLTRDAMEKKVRAAGSAPLSHLTDTTKRKEKKKPRDREEIERDEEAARGKSKRPRVVAKEDLGNVRQTGRRRVRTRGDDEREFRPSRGPRRKSGKNTAAPRKENVVVQLPCSVRTFSEATGVSAGQILKAMMELGTMANINAELDEETTQMLVDQLGLQVELHQAESLEQSLIDSLEGQEDEEGDLEPRPPVVTFLGHVDHGKTSLLDAIIGINVVAGEAGGITQHIRAYTINKDGKTIAFVDTPGHEAFTEMRARGANVTDIAVLVVAADDGVMPQTEEAISHARAAGVPIIVALNKIDVPNANPEKALQDLAAHELLPSEWGGEVEVVRTSAIRGDGLDELLETILVTAELYEYKANPHRNAMGTCLEAQQEPGRGVVAKCIVQNGTLRVGDILVCGSAHGRVKAMFDTLQTSLSLTEAGPSIAVDVIGLDVAPEAGDRLYVLDDIIKARELVEKRTEIVREQGLSGITKRVSLEDFQSRLERGSLADSRAELIKLNLIIRADVRGSIEAIRKELSKISHPEVEINILQSTVGGVTVGDVTLASASDAVIIGFNVVPDEAARALADERQVQIRRYDIIYKITDDIRATLEGRLKPEKRDVDTGSAMVLRTFTVSRSGTIAGCRVMRGTIERDCRVRLVRDSRIIGDYAIESLRREKDDAKEVRQGMECGIKLAGFNDIKEADTFEAYKVEEFARTL